MAFSDVIPPRPYSHTFILTPVWMVLGKESSVMSQVIIISLVTLLISALVRGVANVTTGITISHTGFTPNPNLTGSPGTASILQVYPLLFVAIGLIWAAKHFHAESRGV